MGVAVLPDLFPPASRTQFSRRKSERLFSLVLLMLGFAVIGVGRAYAPLPIRHWFVSVAFQKPTDLLLLPIATLAAMVLHEAGHLLAALLLGFELLGVTLGPIQLQILHRTWKLSLSNRNLFTASVSAIPRNLNLWRAAMICVIAAGPLANLASLFLVASLKTGDHSLAFFQLAFVQVSVLLLVLGLLPTGAVARTYNDARLLFDLAVRNQGFEEMELNVLLTQQVIAGVRPQDYPEGLIARLAAWRGRPESQLLFAQALVRWALDSSLVELADAWDSRVLTLAEDCTSRLQNAALASSASFDLIYREDAESARFKFARVDFNALFPKSFELRARAAHQLALGRIHRANPLIIRAQYAIPPGIPAYVVERLWIEKIHLKVLHKSAAPTGIKYTSASA